MRLHGSKKKKIVIKITTERQAVVTKKIAKDSVPVPGKEVKQYRTMP